MKTIRVLFPALAAAAVLTLSACEKDGPAERAGEEIDEAVDDAGDAVEDAGEKVKDAVD